MMMLMTSGQANATKNQSCIMVEHSDRIDYDCCNLVLNPNEIFDITKYIPLSNRHQNQPIGILIKNKDIVQIKDESFNSLNMEIVYLDLYGNNLSGLSSSTLKGLFKLQYLDLSKNHICFLPESLPNDAFKDLKQLKVLKMISTLCMNATEEYPDELFKPLHSLRELYLRGIANNHLGAGFGQLDNLNKLVFAGKHCHMRNVSRETFRNLEMTALKEIAIINCNVRHISPDALSKLFKLTSVNLACNKYLDFKNAASVIQNMTMTNLESVVLDGLDNDEHVTKLTRDTFCFDTLRSVQRISLRADRIISLNMDIIQCFPHLRHLAIGFNILYTAGNWTDLISNAPNLETLDISYMGSVLSDNFRVLNCHEADIYREFFRTPNQLDQFNLPSEKELTKEFQEAQPSPNITKIPPNLKYVYADHMLYSPWLQDSFFSSISPDNRVLVLNLSSSSSLSRMQTVIKGLDVLRVLDLSNCNIETLPKYDLGQFSHLSHLYLRSNQLGYSDINLANVFKGLTKLKVLDLSENDLTEIKVNDFADLHSLTHLNLQQNALVTWNGHTGHLPKLRFLDLSHNLLKTLDNTIRKQLDHIAENSSEVIEIDLRYNSIICDCWHMDFLQWLNQTSNSVIWNGKDVKCVLNGHTLDGEHAVKVVDVMCHNFQKEKVYSDMLPAWQIVLLCVVPLCLVTVALALTNRYRWALRFCNICGNGCASSSKRERIYSYNVYIASDRSDIRWVVSELLWRIEHEWGMHGCVNFRDFKKTLSTEDNIVIGLDNSAMVVVVVSSAYAMNCSTKFELGMAVGHNTDNIILVELEDLSGCKNVPQVLHQLRKRNPVLKWSQEPTDKQTVFWNDLQTLLEVNTETNV